MRVFHPNRQESALASAFAKAIDKGKLHEIKRKIQELRSIRKTLQHLSRPCRGDSGPECSILGDLALSMLGQAISSEN